MVVHHLLIDGQRYWLAPPLVIAADYDPAAGIWLASDADLGLVAFGETPEACRQAVLRQIADSYRFFIVDDRYAEAPVRAALAARLLPRPPDPDSWHEGDLDGSADEYAGDAPGEG